jgi:hypothetical protein
MASQPSNKPESGPICASAADLAAESPIGQLPAHDHGAETLRNFRYQSAYAVVLLIAAAAKKEDYMAIWCEQEDDVLAQIDTNLFDSYQVKSRKPELGEWRLTDDGMVTAIKGFLRLDAKYGEQFRRFIFVSNVECLESNAANTKHLCPQRLAKAATSCGSAAELAPSESKGLDVAWSLKVGRL